MWAQRAVLCLRSAGAFAASYSQRLSWFGTLRPRVGYALGNWLLYATGGGALGQVETNAAAAVGPFVAADRRGGTRDGWTLGGGVGKSRLAPGWSAKIEYLYLDLGSRIDYLPPDPAGISNASRLERQCDHHRRELPLLIRSARRRAGLLWRVSANDRNRFLN